MIEHSVQLMSCVSDNPIFQSYDKAILSVLCDHAKPIDSDVWRCHPGQDLIATKVDRSTRQVRRRLQCLERLGIIRIRRAKGEGHAGPNTYEINVRYLRYMRAWLGNLRAELRKEFGSGEKMVQAFKARCAEKQRELYDRGIVRVHVPPAWREEAENLPSTGHGEEHILDFDRTRNEGEADI